jgi:hypothetical protein
VPPDSRVTNRETDFPIGADHRLHISAMPLGKLLPRLPPSPLPLPSHICLLLPTDALLGKPRYLLGSGGTLIFDITIVIQSILYRGRSPVKKGGKRRRTATIPREEEALLGGEGLEEEGVPVQEEEQQEFAWPSYGAAGAGADAHAGGVGAGAGAGSEPAEPVRPAT